MFKNLIAGTAAATLVAMPTMALAAPANPAASLSVAQGARAGTPSVRGSKLAGGAGGIAAVAILAGIAAIGVVAIVKDDNSDSN